MLYFCNAAICGDPSPSLRSLGLALLMAAWLMRVDLALQTYIVLAAIRVCDRRFIALMVWL